MTTAFDQIIAMAQELGNPTPAAKPAANVAAEPVEDDGLDFDMGATNDAPTPDDVTGINPAATIIVTDREAKQRAANGCQSCDGTGTEPGNPSGDWCRACGGTGLPLTDPNHPDHTPESGSDDPIVDDGPNGEPPSKTDLIDAIRAEPAPDTDDDTDHTDTDTDADVTDDEPAPVMVDVMDVNGIVVPVISVNAMHDGTATCTRCGRTGDAASEFGWRKVKRFDKDGNPIRVEQRNQPQCKDCRNLAAKKAYARRTGKVWIDPADDKSLAGCADSEAK